MRIGDVEYTRNVTHVQATGAVTELEVVNFAVGIKVRPLLVRTHSSMLWQSAITGNSGIFMENGDSLGAGTSMGDMLGEQRLFCLYNQRRTLVVEGFPIDGPFPHELFWWKILHPTITMHINNTTAADESKITLHYRFVELTDDEIVEIAAQRAQD